MGRKRTKRALSLVEVLISIFILGIMFMSFGPALVFSRMTVEKSKAMEIATQSAHAELEAWRTVPYTELPAISPGRTTTALPVTSAKELPKGKGTVTFVRVDDRLQPSVMNTGRMRVEVKISWDGGKRNKGEVKMDTIVTSDLLTVKK